MAGAPTGPMTPAPAGPAFGQPTAEPPPSGPQTFAKTEEGLTMKKLFDDSTEDERKQLADEMEKQVPGGDLIAAAQGAAEKDPEGASKWDSFLSKRGWTREQAAGWLMEFGLRMLQASGSGQGNVFSDIGESALGATAARREVAKEEEAAARRAKDDEWTDKTRKREEGKWGAQDREEARERKRKAAQEERAKRADARAKRAHEKEMGKGDFKQIITEDGEVIFVDPNTKAEFRTGHKVDETMRSGGRGPTAFEVEWDFYKNAHVPEGWDSLTPTEQADVRKKFMRYKKTSSSLSSVVLRQEMERAQAMMEDRRGEWRGKPFSVVLAAARQKMREEYPELYEGMGVGGNDGFTPSWATDDGWHPPMAE